MFPRLDFAQAPTLESISDISPFQFNRTINNVGISNPIENIAIDGVAATIYPNPFESIVSIRINDAGLLNTNSQLKIYNLLGEELMAIALLNTTTPIETGSLPSGIYFYAIISNHKTIQSGKLISQK